jgi:hypothetical protein
MVPSLTITVMDVLPFASGWGVTTSVRALPAPPSVSPAGVFATSELFDDNAVTTRFPDAVCASLTVKAIVPVAVSSDVVRFAMAEMVGTVFPATACLKFATVVRASLIERALLF